MKLTLIRTDRETGKESFSTLEAENLIAKIKKENKAAHVSALRHLIPILQGTNNHYQNIDKLPRIYPAVEYARTKDGEHRVKIYNGLVHVMSPSIAETFSLGYSNKVRGNVSMVSNSSFTYT